MSSVPRARPEKPIRYDSVHCYGPSKSMRLHRDAYMSGNYSIQNTSTAFYYPQAAKISIEIIDAENQKVMSTTATKMR